MVEVGTLETELLSWKYLDSINSELSGWGLKLPKHDYPSLFNKPFLLARKNFGFNYIAMLETYAAGDGNGFYIMLTYQRGMEEDLRIKKFFETFQNIEELTKNKD